MMTLLNNSIFGGHTSMVKGLKLYHSGKKLISYSDKEIIFSDYKK